MNRIVILASGGLDSSTMLYLYKNLGYDIYPLYIYYGNANFKAEYERLQLILDKLDVPISNRHFLSIDIPWSTGGAINPENSNTYIEMRNLIFLSYAISLAENLGIDKVAIGFIKGHEVYKDASEQFLLDINSLSLGSTGITVVAPLINLFKKDVHKLGKKLGLTLTDTISCHYPIKGEPCGKCNDCLEIKELEGDE